MVTYASISENDALKKVDLIFKETPSERAYITFRKKSKLYYTTDYNPKLYGRILIKVISNPHHTEQLNKEI